MKPNTLSFKKTGLLMAGIFVVLSSFTAAAQKSIYDVIPGSGPKKQGSSKSLPAVINNGDNNHHNRGNSYPVYTHKRKRLPPGQAKKIYGGSAKDYAPGQLKKRHSHHDGNNWHQGKKKHKKHHKHNDD